MNKDDIRAKYDIKDYVEQSVEIPSFDGLNGIVLIVGSSGSGKSTILNSLDYQKPSIDYTKHAIDSFTSIEQAEKLLLAVGLRSIPTWFRPLNTLSNGEKHRAECAIYLDRGYSVIDEFTSVVDRTTAKSLSASLRKFYNQDEPLFVASCHHDIEEWLCPNHIYDTDKKQFIDRRYLRRPEIKLTIKSSNRSDWEMFAKHHYLDTTMSKSVHTYTAYIDDTPVAFYSVIHGCGRDIRTYWRGSRLVVLPEWQGLGIGSKLADAIAEFYVSKGLRFFAKTAHPALGKHRENSKQWKGTSTNKSNRPSYLVNGKPRKSKRYGGSKPNAMRDAFRVCYSHEYIGGGDA